MVFGKMRGQGATEYLVLLAVVLIIALVSIALLGFFPGLATDAKITQSASYWKGEARPFAILENSISTTAGTLILQNVDASGTYTVTNVTLSNTAGTLSSSNTTSIPIGPGATSQVNFAGISAAGQIAAGATQGSVYDLNVIITYTSPSGLSGQREVGAKTLVGKFN